MKALTPTKSKKHRKPRVSKSSSKNYTKMVKVDFPVTFYWTKKNDFDGISVGPMKNATPYEKKQLDGLLKDLSHSMN